MPSDLHDLLPDDLPDALAAEIVGLTRQTFKKRFVESGAVRISEHGRTTLASLESAIGRPITAEQFLKADRACRLTWRRQRRTAQLKVQEGN